MTIAFPHRLHHPLETVPADTPIAVSFEFFPPKTEAMAQTLWASVAELAPLAPDFVSVTYGAGGSTRERTHATVRRILAETGVQVAAHLTCVNASRDEIDAIARAYWDAGVRHIVALRGDPPPTADGSKPRFVPRADGYNDAAELVEGLLNVAPFELSVGAYPEVHPEAKSAEADLAHLRRKFEAGAKRAITQFFFEADTFLRFRDRAAAAGIPAECLVPGILPVSNLASTIRMADMTGTAVPAWLPTLFEGLDERPEARSLVAATVAAELVRRLFEEGVRHFHFYTLNRAGLSYAICHLLGKRPQA
ncbi:MAG: methylenetetrahydrofolate reductase [NAD(P)H] [Sphingomonadaceae bacterium]